MTDTDLINRNYILFIWFLLLWLVLGAVESYVTSGKTQYILMIISGILMLYAMLSAFSLTFWVMRSSREWVPVLLILAAMAFGLPLAKSVVEIVRYKAADDNVSYVVKGEEATVYRVYGDDKCVVLMGSFNGKPVTSIKSHALYRRRKMEEIIIRSPLETIGDHAFRYCSGLKQIKLPKSVVKIGKNSFAGCKSLERITIPPSVTEIPKNAFKGCPENLVIVGEPGSAAQSFAEKYFTFEPLG